jgi:regulatory protein
VDSDERLPIERTALRLLAVREHSRAELCHKLLARGAAAWLVEQVLADLAARNLLSEARFAAHYVEERMGKGYGPLRIRAELGQRGVDADMIDAHLPKDETTWMEVLARTYEWKFGHRPPTDRMELARRARFLEYRGFSSTQVSRFLQRSPLQSRTTHDQ